MKKLATYTSKIWHEAAGKLHIVEDGRYQNGSKRLYITSDKLGPMATLTTSVSRGILKEGCYMIKTWSENEAITRELLDLGIFEDTGLRHPTGWVEAEIWLFVGDKNDLSHHRNR